jgi:NADPH-dependent 2,4-dienoyl-CoA reductase/sulfur reductase-like enzyme
VRRRGKEVLLFEAEETSLASYYDDWFTKDMDRRLAENGVKLHFGELVQEIEGDAKVSGVKTNKGNYQVDMVIMAIGFKPNTALAKDSLETLPNGAYKVNLKQETSRKDVYAIGDCASVYSNAIENSAYIALATNAVRSGVVAGHNACGTALESAGVQGSNGICIWDYKMVSTGLNLKAAAKAGYDPVYTEFEDLQKPAFVKENNHKVKIRIVYDKKTRRILGAQMASFQDISMGIHLFSLAIEEKVTIDKLKLLDIFFLPHFNQPYNYITMAALSAR